MKASLPKLPISPPNSRLGALYQRLLSRCMLWLLQRALQMEGLEHHERADLESWRFRWMQALKVATAPVTP